jgi:uncharacterized membrane protein
MRISFFFPLILLAFAFPVHAAEMPQSSVTNELAKVISIIEEEQRPIPGTGTNGLFQTLRAEILEGTNKGSVVTVQNDYLALKVGEKFYMLHTIDASENLDIYAVFEPYRMPQLLALAGLFVLIVLVFGGLQGMRALLSLAASFFFIGYLLLPGILHGFPPILVAMGVSALIVLLSSYVTHGFNKVTTSAVLGMLATIALSGLLAYFAIDLTRLSGFSSEEAVALNFDTAGSINFAGLLLGGVLIGLLGVLYDAAIGQSAAVDELSHAAPEASRKQIYKQALRIGREHIGALVNTLAIAYVGVSLPLLLLFYRLSPDTSFMTTINREIFATEIVRAMIGGIGIVLAVPITTLIASHLLVSRKKKHDGPS